MGSEVKISTTLSLLAIFVISMSSAAATDNPQFHSSLENFSTNIFTKIYESHGGHNIIYSPFSIQTCLAMVRMAADGQTAVEMDNVLNFNDQSADSVADSYHTMLAKYENSDILKIANKVYVMKGYELKDKYNEILSTKFFSSAENIDFGQSAAAADTINTWVESKTNNAIKDLIKSDTFSSDTRLFLLSAIYFKGSWKMPFDPKLTSEKDFYTNKNNTIKVQMMHQNKKADYASFYDDLHASAVRLPYQNSDLSMVIFLPHSRNGLAALQEKLRNVELKSLFEQTKFFHQTVRLSIPKFKAELKITLNDVLKKMGMNKMFADADFSKMLKSPQPLTIDSVIHKAFIEVNEEGAEIAAATGPEFMLLSGPREFLADHPFYYVVINEDAVPLFQGTFVGA